MIHFFVIKLKEYNYLLKPDMIRYVIVCDRKYLSIIFQSKTSKPILTSIYHLEESHLTSMDRLHMRPGGQQQEEQVNVDKQPIPQQISHLLLSECRFDLPLLCLYSIFSSLFFLFNPPPFLNLIVFLLFPPPPPLQWMMDGLSAPFSLCI